MHYEYFENGTYLEVDATGDVYDIPGNCTALRIHCETASAYFKLGSDTLTIADCLKPTSNEDPCSPFVPIGYCDVKLCGATKIAIISTSTVSKIRLIPYEIRG